MAIQRTLVLVKPDAVQRGLVGEVIGRLERRGLHPVAMKLLSVPRESAERHYHEHRGKPFFESLVDFIVSSPVVAMVWEGPEAITLVRTMIGATHPAAAIPGSIRGDLAVSLGMNVVHGSDSEESAARETAIFFAPEELVEWNRGVAVWVVEP